MLICICTESEDVLILGVSVGNSIQRLCIRVRANSRSDIGDMDSETLHPRTW